MKMTFLLKGIGRWVAVAALGSALAAFIASGGLDNFGAKAIEDARKGGAKEVREAGDAAKSTGEEISALPSEAAEEYRSIRSAVLGAIWGAIRLPLLVLAILAAVVVALRWRARRRRRYARYHVRPYESDVGRTGSITDTWDEIQHAVLRRWWRRLLTGQPSISAEVHNIRSRETRVWEQRLVLVVPDEERVINNIEAAMRSTYEHVRFDRLADGQAPPWLDHVVRLKRARSFVKGRLATPVFTADGEEAQHEFGIDRLVSAMSEMQVPATVQLALTPTPGSFERLAHWSLRKREEEQLKEIGGDDAGTRSMVTKEELEGAAEGIAHRPLFFGEIRVAASEREVAEQLATVIQGTTRRGESKLVRRFARLRRGLYASRLARGEGNPLPSFLRGVYATAEIAAIWRVPNPFRNAGRITSHPTPRLRVDPSIRRVPADEGIVVVEEGMDNHAERGLALHARDYRANLGILGTVESGKTTSLIRAGLTLAREPNRALFFLDPKADGWRRFLAALETDPERPIYVINFARPEAGFSPLRGSLPIEKRVEAVEQGVLEMHRTEQGEVQMYAPSRAALNVFSEASMRLLEDATFDDVATMLSVTEAGYHARAWVKRAMESDRDGGHDWAGLNDELDEIQAQLDDAKSAFTQRLAAPRNKVSRLRLNPMREILRHPVQVDIARAIEERAIVVVNGAQGEIGTEAMQGLMSMFLALFVSSVLRQQAIPESERADVSLILDEAHYFLGNAYLREGFATARSAGLASILAFQHLGQLGHGQALRDLTALIGSWLFFRIAPEDAAAVSNLLQPAHTDVHLMNDDVLERLAVNPRALSAAPQFSAIGTFIVRGSRSPGFTAGVEPVRENPALLAENMQRQRGRIRARGIGERDLQAPVRPWEGKARDDDKSQGVEPPREETRARKPARRPSASPDQLKIPTTGENGASESGGAEAGAPGTADPAPAPPTGTDAANSANGSPEPAPAVGEAGAGGGGRAAPEVVGADGGEEAGEAAKVEEPAQADPAASEPEAQPVEAADEETVRVELPALEDGVALAAEHPIPTNLPPLPGLFTELERYDHVSGIKYHEPQDAPSPRPKRDGSKQWVVVEGAKQPDVTQLEVMRMLWEFESVAQFQITQRFYKSRQRASTKMKELYELGLVERFVVTTRAKGKDPYLYRLTRAGFELLKLTVSRRGAYLPQSEEWREDHSVIARQVGGQVGEDEWKAKRKRQAVTIAHDIETVSWALAFENLAAPCIRQVLGKQRCWQLPPAVKVDRSRNEYVTKTAQQISGLPGRPLCNLDFEFGAVRPDVAFEIEIDTSTGERRFDLLIEYQRTGLRKEKVQEKLRNYDALITGWWREKARYKEFGEAPTLLFVVPDWDAAYKYAQFADGVMHGAIGKPTWPASRWTYEGRQRVFFTAAQFVHQRTTLAYQLPRLPPDVRGALAANSRERRAAEAPQPGGVVEFPPRKSLADPTPIERSRTPVVTAPTA